MAEKGRPAPGVARFGGACLGEVALGDRVTRDSSDPEIKPFVVVKPGDRLEVRHRLGRGGRGDLLEPGITNVLFVSSPLGLLLLSLRNLTTAHVGVERKLETRDVDAVINGSLLLLSLLGLGNILIFLSLLPPRPRRLRARPRRRPRTKSRRRPRRRSRRLR